MGFVTARLAPIEEAVCWTFHHLVCHSVMFAFATFLAKWLDEDGNVGA